jgi:DNA repair photolyase
MLDSPLPRFDLLKIDRYRSMTIQFGRGCPFSCEFCDIIVVYGRRPRTKSVPQPVTRPGAVFGPGSYWHPTPAP